MSNQERATAIANNAYVLLINRIGIPVAVSIAGFLLIALWDDYQDFKESQVNALKAETSLRREIDMDHSRRLTVIEANKLYEADYDGTVGDLVFVGKWDCRNGSTAGFTLPAKSDDQDACNFHFRESGITVTHKVHLSNVAGQYNVYVEFPRPMFAAPTVTVKDNAGNTGKYTAITGDFTGTVDNLAAVAAAVTQGGYRFDSSTYSKTGVQFEWTASAEF